MVSGTLGHAGLTAEASRPAVPGSQAPGAAPVWDRFAHWSPLAARLGLLALLLMLLASALVPLEQPGGDPRMNAVPNRAVVGSEEYDQDIALYESAIRRIAAGENYYDFIASEHRRRDYPVRPAIAVRLPTLAYIEAGLALLHLETVVPIAIMLGTVFVWWRGFGRDPGVGRLRRVATALVFVGASLALNKKHYYSLHELWAGMLLALSLGLYRVGEGQEGEPGAGSWGAAFLCAALALFIRELALPFVLLMGAMALWRRDWREAGAWAALVLVFLAVLAWHLSIVSAQILPSDPEGPDWMTLRGLSGWLGNLVQSSNLRLLPHWLAGPMVVLMMLGWAGWRTRTGAFAFLIAVGYGLAFMVIGRWDNFYWGAMIAPMLIAGLAFAPRAAGSLARAAGLK